MSDNRMRAGDDLAAMFGIEFDPDASLDGLRDTGATAAYAATLCAKCNGRGKFVGWSGRVVGDCFACDGSGLSAAEGSEALQPGDCVKCAGSGAWRPGRPCFACDGTGKDRAVSDAAISVEPIARAFASAHSAGVKTPRLRLGAFVFSRAPDHGKNAGAIYVKRSGEYLGKVTDGRFRPVMSCDAGTATKVIEVAANPHEAALAYGAETKRCSCCGLTLTNEESKRLGIGPICRAKYGWG